MLLKSILLQFQCKDGETTKKMLKYFRFHSMMKIQLCLQYLMAMAQILSLTSVLGNSQNCSQAIQITNKEIKKKH